MSSYLYCYHLPSMNSIKIGFGDDPKARMLHYSKVYRLRPDHASLKSWPLPISGIAIHLEKSCHREFESLGMHRKNISGNYGEAQEVFELFDVGYDGAVKIIDEIVGEELGQIISALRVQKNKINTKRQREAARQQYAERAKKQRDAEMAIIQDCARIIKDNLAQKTFVPLSAALDRAKAIMLEKPSSQKRGIFDFRKARLTGDELFYNWERRGEFVPLVVEVFHLDRKLRYCELRLKKKYLNEVGAEYLNIVSEGVAMAGWDFWRPAPRHSFYNPFQILYSLDSFGSRRLVALREVEHAVQNVMGVGSSVAVRIIDESAKLRELFSFAYRELPPELMKDFSFSISEFDVPFANSLRLE